MTGITSAGEVLTGEDNQQQAMLYAVIEKEAKRQAAEEALFSLALVPMLEKVKDVADAVKSGRKTTADIYSFGNKSAPRGARPKQDFDVENFDSIVGPEIGPLPKGASNVLDVNSAPLNGHYHMLPSGTQMPDGLDVIPDSPHGVGHYTIFPTKEMTVNELYKSLLWQYGGKK